MGVALAVASVKAAGPCRLNVGATIERGDVRKDSDEQATIGQHWQDASGTRPSSAPRHLHHLPIPFLQALASCRKWSFWKGDEEIGVRWG